MANNPIYFKVMGIYFEDKTFRLYIYIYQVLKNNILFEYYKKYLDFVSNYFIYFNRFRLF